MSDEPPESREGGSLDVVLLHGPTDDGEGARVLRARGAQVEVGEVRPLREGRSLAPRTEVVRLTPRSEAPNLFDVHVEHAVDSQAGSPSSATAGPPQVATRAYRESWERTFGPRRADPPN
jgi:hypothetical protein